MELPLFILLAASEWDIALTIGLFVLGGSMSLTAWFFKERMKAYDEHLKECAKRAEAAGRAEQRLEHMESGVVWLGNCIISIGVKLGVELPPRAGQ